DMPLTMQVKLLRVLQEKKIIRVGGTTEIPINVRILSATNRDLRKAMEQGRFRRDLYYRINVVPLFIPPLREHKDDIPLLVSHFLAKFSLMKKTEKMISPEAMELLISYDYPGNIRELGNIIERSLAMCSESEIKAHHLPADLGMGRKSLVSVPSGEETFQSLEEHEVEYILSILKKVDGNKSRAAKIIGIDRVSLWRKLKRYDGKGFDVAAYL
ncbi:MAG: sigma 54-interacting transcriptional regulator, partial [Desulfobulbaceae bacterium]|nr:sigma 54-interacting transcriptional regulator [Desulfobulbaceae bacterium]